MRIAVGTDLNIYPLNEEGGTQGETKLPNELLGNRLQLLDESCLSVRISSTLHSRSHSAQLLYQFHLCTNVECRIQIRQGGM